MAWKNVNITVLSMQSKCRNKGFIERHLAPGDGVDTAM
jgi:hypothetical protein